jgi:hypothetical protein
MIGQVFICYQTPISLVDPGKKWIDLIKYSKLYTPIQIDQPLAESKLFDFRLFLDYL